MDKVDENIPPHRLTRIKINKTSQIMHKIKLPTSKITIALTLYTRSLVSKSALYSEYSHLYATPKLWDELGICQLIQNLY